MALWRWARLPRTNRSVRDAPLLSRAGGGPSSLRSGLWNARRSRECGHSLAALRRGGRPRRTAEERCSGSLWGWGGHQPRRARHETPGPFRPKGQKAEEE